MTDRPLRPDHRPPSEVAADLSADRTPGTLPGAVPAEPPARRAGRGRLPRRLVPALAASTLTLAAVATLTNRFDALAQVFHGPITTPAPAPAPPPAAPAPPAEDPATPAPDPGTYTFADHALHPDRLFQPYFGGELVASDDAPAAELIGSFRRFFDRYARRQGEDDNFTVRLTDVRTEETVEVYELRAERAAFERTGTADWEAVDRLRREATTRLLDRYANNGRPRATLDVKWGRANQVREARERDAPFLAYEVNLARTLGLSLLATEIGTVETFNDDRLVSTVGARSRYQMMPDILRAGGIRRYNLRTVSGAPVPVAEERATLLTMEHAFLVLRGYANAVGHEIPGISAYHTGPGNIWGVYRAFLANGGRYSSPTASVMDAYVWAVTAGYPLVSSTSSFKTYSRGYVASAYGALRATEQIPVDPSRTFRADLVRVRPGVSVPLSRLLTVLDGADLDWNRAVGGAAYEAFRAMNPHLMLPAATAPGVPLRGDVLLTATAEGGPVRFFLPIGAADVLRRAGVDVLDGAGARFDEATFQAAPGEETEADREYAALVRRTERIAGFTLVNRARLDALADRFETLALTTPTPYRRAQLEVIRTHRRLWRSEPFEKLAAAAATAGGTAPAPILPTESFLPPPAAPSVTQ